jgi:hypothetical protein
MRSEPVGEQQCLPFEEPRRETARGVRRGAGAAEPPPSYRLGAELVATRGWPAGTEIVVDRRLRPARGDVVAVREHGRVSVGVFDRRFGRSVLLSDRGVAWIGPATEVLGVATVVGAALDGMPG